MVIESAGARGRGPRSEVLRSLAALLRPDVDASERLRELSDVKPEDEAGAGLLMRVLRFNCGGVPSDSLRDARREARSRRWWCAEAEMGGECDELGKS